MIEKSKGLASDQVFLDLEDAVAPLAKDDARRNVVAALNEGGYGDRIRAVRVNDWTTAWTYRDVVEVVGGAGANLDCLILPKVHDAGHVVALDLLLTQVEKANGLPVGRIGIETQIETAHGLVHVNEIAGAGPRVQAVAFGPVDFMADIGMSAVDVDDPRYPGDPLHYVLMQVLLAARANGVQAVDGPYVHVRDVEGFRRSARRSALLGFDGKWVLHPDQIAAANEVFSPSQEDYEHAELVLDAYDYWTSPAGGSRGAVMLGEEMIDEASRKIALGVAAQGRAAGLSRTRTFVAPDQA